MSLKTYYENNYSDVSSMGSAHALMKLGSVGWDQRDFVAMDSEITKLAGQLGMDASRLILLTKIAAQIKEAEKKNIFMKFLGGIEDALLRNAQKPARNVVKPGGTKRLAVANQIHAGKLSNQTKKKKLKNLIFGE